MDRAGCLGRRRLFRRGLRTETTRESSEGVSMRGPKLADAAVSGKGRGGLPNREVTGT